MERLVELEHAVRPTIRGVSLIKSGDPQNGNGDMSPENFAYWLQGFIELTKGQAPDLAQWKSIKEHLDLVFNKVTPPVDEDNMKVTIDMKDAEKTIEDLCKAYDELAEKMKKYPFYVDKGLPGQLPFYDWKAPLVVTC